MSSKSSKASSSKAKRVDETPTNNDDDDDSDIESGGEDEQATSVDVGLVDDTDPSELDADELALTRVLLTSPFFPSKIGGKPAWLDYTNLPTAQTPTAQSDLNNNNNNNKSRTAVHLACDSCHSQLVFLLQLYAPITDTDKYAERLEDKDKCFHRTLFVFMCTAGTCKRRTFRVLRSQLARHNDFYSSAAPPSDADDPDQLSVSRLHFATFCASLADKKKLNLCAVCGVASVKKCARCSFAHYCSQAHQVLDWSQLGHKLHCASYTPSVDEGRDQRAIVDAWIRDETTREASVVKVLSGSGGVLPEYEMLIDAEVLDKKKMREEEKRAASRIAYDEKSKCKHLTIENEKYPTRYFIMMMMMMQSSCPSRTMVRALVEEAVTTTSTPSRTPSRTRTLTSSRRGPHTSRLK